MCRPALLVAATTYFNLALLYNCFVNQSLEGNVLLCYHRRMTMTDDEIRAKKAESMKKLRKERDKKDLVRCDVYLPRTAGREAREKLARLVVRLGGEYVARDPRPKKKKAKKK